MNKQVAKSPEILEKEALIKDLQSRLKKKKTALKSLKTRLKNTQQEITEIQRAGSGQIMSKMAKMEKLRLELVGLVQKMLNMKEFSREDKAALKSMEKGLSDEDMFGEDFKAFRAQMGDMEDFDYEAQFSDEERAKMRDIFKAFAVKPTKEEQKDIRKVFISLSQKFHPDKAPTKADEAEYHEMMQKINEAYQAGDIQTLLELERLFLSENLDLTKVQSISVDVLQQEIDRLERDLQFIENQISRNSHELKSLRASDLGKMLTDIKKAEKTGQGMNAALEQLDEGINKLQSTKEAFEACIKLGNTQPLEEMMMAENANQPSQAEMMAMLEEMMSEGMDPNDLADMFDTKKGSSFFFGEDNVENAKFREGQSVKIAKNVYDEYGGVALGGLQGRVESIYYGVDMVIMYEIELDSVSLNKLPLEFVEVMVKEEEDFQNFEIPETGLKKCQPRDSEDDTKGAYRTLFHKYNWHFESEATQKRLQSILLHKANHLDWENWQLFLEKKLKFPIAAQSRGMMEFRKGEKIKITKLAGYNEEVGLIVDVNYRNRPGNYPLFDLIPVANNKNLRQFFDDYLIWAVDIHEVAGF